MRMASMPKPRQAPIESKLGGPIATAAESLPGAVVVPAVGSSRSRLRSTLSVGWTTAVRIMVLGPPLPPAAGTMAVSTIKLGSALASFSAALVVLDRDAVAADPFLNSAMEVPLVGNDLAPVGRGGRAVALRLPRSEALATAFVLRKSGSSVDDLTSLSAGTETDADALVAAGAGGSDEATDAGADAGAVSADDDAASFIWLEDTGAASADDAAASSIWLDDTGAASAGDAAASSIRLDDTGATPDAGAGTGTGAGTEAEAEAGAKTRAEAGAETGAETGAEAGAGCDSVFGSVSD